MTRLLGISVTVDISTNKSEERLTFHQGEEETVAELMARVAEEVSEAVEAEVG